MDNDAFMYDCHDIAISENTSLLSNDLFSSNTSATELCIHSKNIRVLFSGRIDFRFDKTDLITSGYI